MNKNKAVIAGLTIVLITLVTPGCLENFNMENGGVTYEAHPTTISYTVRYGYLVNCSGTGKYNILYDSDLPEILIGSVSQQLLYEQDYKTVTLANNSVIRWNISGRGNNDYELGILANVRADAFLVSDLNGEEALTIGEIKDNHPDKVDQYCKKQSVGNITYIDPEDISIRSTSWSIRDQVDSNNSFSLAKQIFIWLKQNTVYKTHTADDSVQPARTTFLLRSGDCDDLSFLFISLCRSLNIPARFVRGILIEEQNGVVDVVAHAWSEVFVGGNIGKDGWIPVECAGTADNVKSEVNQNFGVESAGHLRLFKDDGSNQSMEVSISGPKALYDPGITIIMKPFLEVENLEVIVSKELHVDGEGNRAYKSS